MHSLQFDYRTKPYHNLNFISIIHAAQQMELTMMPLVRQTDSPTPKLMLLVEPVLPGRARQIKRTTF